MMLCDDLLRIEQFHGLELTTDVKFCEVTPAELELFSST